MRPDTSSCATSACPCDHSPDLREVKNRTGCILRTSYKDRSCGEKNKAKPFLNSGKVVNLKIQDMLVFQKRVMHYPAFNEVVKVSSGAMHMQGTIRHARSISLSLAVMYKSISYVEVQILSLKLFADLHHLLFSPDADEKVLEKRVKEVKREEERERESRLIVKLHQHIFVNQI